MCYRKNIKSSSTLSESANRNQDLNRKTGHLNMDRLKQVKFYSGSED